MAMLYDQEQDRFLSTCNSCEKQVETRYHCSACVDFDLCVNCFNKDGHQHKMNKFGYDNSVTGDQKQTKLKDSHQLSIQRCIKYLVHSCLCRDDNCRLPSCHKMKRVVHHCKSCKLKTNGGCPICKQLIALCCYHAKQCQEDKCPVLFCVTIKPKMRQKQLQQGLQEVHILKRRFAAMQFHGLSNAVLQPTPGNSNSSCQRSPFALPHASSHLLQPVIGMNQSSGPPIGALQVQSAAVRSTEPHITALNYDKGNPFVNPTAADTGLMTPNQQMQAQMQNPMLTMMSGVPNRMLNMRNVASGENSGYAENQQPQFDMWEASQIMNVPNTMPNFIENSTMRPPQIMPNPGSSTTGMQNLTEANKY